MTVTQMTQETDADAVYIKTKLADADRLDNEAITKGEAAVIARKEAVARFHQVREGFRSDKPKSGPNGGRPTLYPGWQEWMVKNEFARQTVEAMLREYGYPEEQRTEAKAKEATRKREQRKVGASTVIARATGRAVGGSDVRKVEKALGESLKGKKLDAEEAQVLQDKAAAILAPEKAANDIAIARADLSLTMQEKYDRALASALTKQTKEQEDTFWAKVREQVKQQLPKEKADALQIMKDYTAKLKGVAGHLSMEDYRFLLRILHPDRTPDATERAKGFAIVSKLDEYMRASTR